MKPNVFANVRRAAILAAVGSLVVTGCAVPGNVVSEAPGPVATPPVSASGSAPSLSASAASASAPSPSSAGAATPLAQLPPPTADEARTGIQVAQVGLAAAGGLVDLRLKVLDAAKATKLLGNPANVPLLIARDGPPLHPPHHAMRGVKFGTGVVYYVLYPNARGAIKPGVEVTVAMGDVRLGPVTVQ